MQDGTVLKGVMFSKIPQFGIVFYSYLIRPRTEQASNVLRIEIGPVIIAAIIAHHKPP